MKNILYICDYGAIYTGSFIAAMAMLTQRAGEKYQVYFLFPETARGRKWLPLLPVPEERIYFSDFSVKSLAAACHRLSAELKPDSTVVHTHFVGDFRLLAVRSAFSDIICHYHMMVPIGYTLMKKVKQLIRRVIYWGLVIVGVSEAVQKDAVRYFWNVRSECVPNAIDFDMLEKCSAEPVLLDAAHTGQFRVLVHGSDCFCKGADLAIQAIARADLLIVGGTSLTVYPAAGLLRYYSGNRLVLINRDRTPYDDEADLVFHDSLRNVFSLL